MYKKPDNYHLGKCKHCLSASVFKLQIELEIALFFRLGYFFGIAKKIPY